ncbi:MAG: peptidoglycan -binding protein [Rhodospirillales bacterium]|nr:peptidoglycan -binding protein [Rhodospirillales bacterium]
MATLVDRRQRATNIWPGFVDALATLLMVIMFLLMVFVLAQFFLGQALSGRDQALVRLQNQVNELADLLSLERRASDDLRKNISQLSQELQISVALRDDLKTTVAALRRQAEETGQRLAGALKTIETDQAKIAAQVQELAGLQQDIAALKALREELQAKVAELGGKLAESGKKLLAEREISQSARAQVALLNKQMAALRETLEKVSAALDASEKLAREQKVEIQTLGARLNAALAGKVQQLSRYRSEFFGRLREVLGDQPDVRIVGDRFVFQSEVLFAKGSADIGSVGKAQLTRLAQTLRQLAAKIPADIDWVLRVDGHTDKDPISTPRFPSNWELSSARAISVIRFLMDEGLSPDRLAATGFGEYQPLDAGNDEIAKRRNRRIELKLTER